MSHAVRARGDGDVEVPPDLARMLKRVDEYWRTEVKQKLRKRRHALTRGEALRLKRRLFRERLERKRRQP